MTRTLHQREPESATQAPLPNFIGIGAQRAATTWLHECLAEHPDVFVPDCKEVHFFSLKFEEGLDWYRQHFAGVRGERCIGEITPGYLGREESLPRIAEVLPDARLFVVLRNPIDRAFSAYQLLRPNLNGRSFSEAIRDGCTMVSFGLYAYHLKRAYELFPPERVKILLYDDIGTDPAGTVAELYRYLEVDDSFVPSALSKRLNRIVYPQAQKMLRSVGLGWALSLVKRTPIAEYVKQRAKPPERRPSPEDTDYLRERFRPDVEELQTMLGRDLSHWLDKP